VNKNFVQKFGGFSRRKLIFGKIIFKKKWRKIGKYFFGKKVVKNFFEK